MTRAGSRMALVGAALALAFPWLPFVSYSILGTANLGAYYAMVAVSLVVLTGWVGQISLGHAGLVGVGAYTTGFVVATTHVAFPANLMWAAAASAGVAALLGAVALRVRGLYLAVATLIFSWMASEFLFGQAVFNRYTSIEVRRLGEAFSFPEFDFASRRTYYYAAWAIVAGAVYLMANLRDSKTGRAFFAVRGSEVAAASLGISVVRTKLTAFAVSGALAGVAGNLLIVRDQLVSPDAFQVQVSLFFLAIAVVGGLSSLGGAVAASLLFATLNELFFRVAAFAGWLEVVPPLLLAVVLLAYRGGLAAIPSAVSKRVGPLVRPVADAMDALRRRVASEAGARPRIPVPPIRVSLPAPVARLVQRLRPSRPAPKARLDLQAALDVPVPAAANGNGGHPSPEAPSQPTWRSAVARAVALSPRRPDRELLVAAEGVTVRFGGLVAVDDVSLEVREHEIVGLIGPNGAGKTTMFNSIAGLNVPTAGRIRMFGEDVTDWTVDERARLGVGRTFQAIQLLPQLTVFENLLVATHVHNPSRLLSNVLAGPTTLAAERDGREQVHRVATLLELEPCLDRRAMDLPFGLLRMVELARALVTGAPFMMLDEPASGLDDRETERFTEILRFVRSLGVTILLIEHDVHMVTSVSDYLYVLDQGRLISQGLPTDVQRDEAVVAAYLGAPPEAVAMEPLGVPG